MANNRKLLIALFLIAFAVRLIAAVAYLNFDSHALTMHKPFLPPDRSPNEVWQVIGDNDRYNTLAHRILNDGTIGKTDGRAPLYPVLLAACYFIFGFNIFAFFIPQILLAAASSILVFFLAERLGGRKVGIMASLFYALNPHFVLISIQLYAETLYFFLLLCLFLFCDRLFLSPRKTYAIYTGISMALAALCRSVFLVFAPFLFIWIIAVFHRKRREMSIILVYAFMSFLIIYGIWAARDSWAISSRIHLSLTSASWETEDLSDLQKIYIPPATYKDVIATFIGWAKENPERFFGRVVKQLKIFLFAPYAEGVSLRHKIVSSLLFFTIYPLGYIGLIAAVRERKKIALLALLFVISMIIFHSFHFLTALDGELRYRLPAELVVTIFAAYAIVNIPVFSAKKR